MGELSSLTPWFAILLSLASILYSIISNRSKDTARKFEDLTMRIGEKASKDTTTKLAGKLDLVEDRTTRIESELKHLPDHQMVNKLERMVGELSAEVGVLSERIRPVAAIADRLQEKILESAGFKR